MLNGYKKNLVILGVLAVILIIIVIAIWPSMGQNELEIKIAEFEKVANEAYEECVTEGKEPNLSNVKEKLEEKGYEVEKVTVSEPLKGIAVANDDITVQADKETEVEIIFEENEDANKYYATIQEKYYQMKLENEEIKVSSTEETEIGTSITPKSDGYELKVTSSNLNIEATAENNKIILNSRVADATAVLTIEYGEFKKTCNVTVIARPSETAEADSSIKIATNYGTVDVIWLDRGNNVIREPLDPEGYLIDMKKVTWTYNEKTKKWEEDEEAQSDWYEYKASTNTNDGKESRWANAKFVQNDTESYFVWIPRYAYRITYYSDKNYSDITGYYDGYGMWSAKDGKKKYNLDDDIETVTYNGEKYIVHPAFVDETKNKVAYSNGGWDKELAGIWVAKYEMSGSKEELQSVPNKEALGNMTIGEQYTSAINYRTSYSSHMLKNSEWGAVVYLAQSQYGRNGHEIDVNDISNYITGNGGGTIPSTEITGTENAYNTKIGAQASTTGNVYGIYDLSGNMAERVAAFNNMDTNDYLTTSGWISATGLTKDKESTKYATKYYSTETSSTSEVNIGKIGDATKEVNTETGSVLAHWFGNTVSFISPEKPFMARGGSSNYTPRAGIGIFYLNGITGKAEEDEGFRVVLCP